MKPHLPGLQKSPYVCDSPKNACGIQKNGLARVFKKKRRVKLGRDAKTTEGFSPRTTCGRARLALSAFGTSRLTSCYLENKTDCSAVYHLPDKSRLFL